MNLSRGVLLQNLVLCTLLAPPVPPSTIYWVQEDPTLIRMIVEKMIDFSFNHCGVFVCSKRVWSNCHAHEWCAVIR